MAGDGSAPPTSTEQLRVLQYNDKMATLNGNFIQQLQHWFNMKPHYDFSDSVKSYLDHVERLDGIYFPSQTQDKETKENISHPSKTNEHTDLDISHRSIAKAKRRSQVGSGGNSSFKVSTPAVPVPPRLSFGDVSVITTGSNADTTIQTAPASAVRVADKAGDSNSSVVRSAGGKKRAIRGGGPLGGSEQVIIRGQETNSSHLSSAAIPTIQLPKPTSGFWTKKTSDNGAKDKPEQADNSTKDTNKLSIPQFKFGQKNEDADKNSGIPTFTFGEPKKNDEKSDNSTQSVSLFQFTAKKDDKKDSSSSSTPLFQFSAKDSTSETTNSPFGSAATGPSLFGNVPAPSGGSLFSFGTLPKTSTENINASSNDAPDDEAPYEPPKAEVVETEEEGSSYNTKCSVMKLVDAEYKKLGVGILHFKEVGGKQTFLVRAATTLGSVMLNTLLNKSVKVVKIEDKNKDKIRLTCPLSKEELGVFVLRFPSTAVAEKVFKHAEEFCS